MADNPNERVTRADLDQQLEIHAKTIELQILLSRQQEQILDKLTGCTEAHKVQEHLLRSLDTRSFKQTWLLIGLIGAIIAEAASIISRFTGG